MPTYLEQEAIVRRDELEKKNDYIDDVKEYSGEKTPIGKGTGNGGHTHFLPDHSLDKHIINYSNFDTTQGGSSDDINGRGNHPGRIGQVNRTIYNENYRYGLDIIDMSANIGQYSTDTI
jgi:hypothetical protein